MWRVCLSEAVLILILPIQRKHSSRVGGALSFPSQFKIQLSIFLPQSVTLKVHAKATLFQIRKILPLKGLRGDSTPRKWDKIAPIVAGEFALLWGASAFMERNQSFICKKFKHTCQFQIRGFRPRIFFLGDNIYMFRCQGHEEKSCRILKLCIA